MSPAQSPLQRSSTILIYSKLTVTRGLLEHVFCGHRTILASEVDDVYLLVDKHSVSLIVASLDVTCLKIVKGFTLIPVLIVANAASSEPLDGELARQCTRLGGAFIRNLETTSLLARAYSLIQRFQEAQAVFEELKSEGDMPYPKFNPLEIHKDPRGISMSNRPIISHGITKRVELDRRRRCALNSPRTSVGMNRQQCAFALSLLKKCIDTSSDCEILRSVDDVTALIEKSQLRSSSASERPTSAALSQFKKGLRDMLAPKGVDILLENNFELVPPKAIRRSVLGTLLQRGYDAYLANRYEETCMVLDLAALRHPTEIMVYFWRALAGANLGFYIQAVRDLDRALTLSVAFDEFSRPRRLPPSGVRERHRSKLELAIRFNRAIARANMGDDHGALQDLGTLLHSCPENLLYRRQHAVISRRCGDWKCAFVDYTITRGPRTKGNSKACPGDASRAKSQNLLGSKMISKMTRKSSPDARMSLSEFRSSIGESVNVVEAIFPNPSDLQVALSTPPGMRNSSHIDTIVKMLITMPLFSAMRHDSLEFLATSAGHCLLESRDTLLVREGEIDSCYLILSGAIGVRLLSYNEIHAVVGNLSIGDVFGDVPLLLTSQPSRNEPCNSVEVGASDDEQAEVAPKEKKSSELCIVSSMERETKISHPSESRRGGTRKKGQMATIAESYQAQVPTELLSIPRTTFDRVLRRAAYQCLQGRYAVLVSTTRASQEFVSKFCADLSVFVADRRLICCMQVLSHQGEVPEFLYVLNSGLCRVTSLPDQKAYLQQRIGTIRQELDRTQLLYSYHHSLRQRSARPCAHQLRTDKQMREPENLVERIRNFGDGTTVTEDKIARLWRELRSYEIQLESYRRADGEKALPRVIGVMIPPGVCGEAGILSEGNPAAYSVVTDTLVHAVSIHKVVFQVFSERITPTFLENLRKRSRCSFGFVGGIQGESGKERLS